MYTIKKYSELYLTTKVNVAITEIAIKTSRK